MIVCVCVYVCLNVVVVVFSLLFSSSNHIIAMQHRVQERERESIDMMMIDGDDGRNRTKSGFGGGVLNGLIR